jgi:hypothetical protein
MSDSLVPGDAHPSLLYSAPQTVVGDDLTQPSRYIRSINDDTFVLLLFFCTAKSRSPGMSADAMVSSDPNISATLNSMFDCPEHTHTSP